MRQYLPSKKFLYTLGSILLVILLVLGAKLLNDRRPDPTPVAKDDKIPTVQEFLAVDSDGDGLKDWEEALWKTDSKKTDTDGDGTTDSDEIKVDRDPTKANTAPKNKLPNDKIDEKVLAEQKQNEEEFNKLNTTDKVGRVLLAQYLITKKVGQAITQTDIANVINNALSSMPPPVFRQYTLNDLNIYTATNTEQFGNYLKQASLIITNHKPEEIVDFSGIVNSISENDTNYQLKAKLQKLQPLAESCKTITLDLLSVRVPSSLAEKHLALINAFALLSDNLFQIIDSSNDPMKLLALINTYPDSVRKLQSAAGAKFSVL